MDRLTKTVLKPSSVLIEQTAADLAATFYEVGLSQGIPTRHKTHKAFVHHNIEKFIPKAVEILTDMLANPATPQEQRDCILEALLERASDPELAIFNEKIEFKEPEKKPVIIRPMSDFDKAWEKAKRSIA